MLAGVGKETRKKKKEEREFRFVNERKCQGRQRTLEYLLKEKTVEGEGRKRRTFKGESLRHDQRTR